MVEYGAQHLNRFRNGSGTQKLRFQLIIGSGCPFHLNSAPNPIPSNVPFLSLNIQEWAHHIIKLARKVVGQFVK
jgi:hypothetical protein